MHLIEIKVNNHLTQQKDTSRTAIRLLQEEKNTVSSYWIKEFYYFYTTKISYIFKILRL